MVTTHDLALAEIPQTIGEFARETSISRSSIEDRSSKFDYRLHPGIVRTSNALTLMQAVGLKLEE